MKRKSSKKRPSPIDENYVPRHFEAAEGDSAAIDEAVSGMSSEQTGRSTLKTRFDRHARRAKRS